MKRLICFTLLAAVVVVTCLLVHSGTKNRINGAADMFESNVEALAEIESPGGFGPMCVTRFDVGNCRYNRCGQCDNWEMCKPIEIKYCP